MDATPLAWPLSRIVEYARGPRHNGAGVDRIFAWIWAWIWAWISAWIWEFGFKVACLVCSGREPMDVPPRLKAARRLGLREIRVLLSGECTAAQVKVVGRTASCAEMPAAGKWWPAPSLGVGSGSTSMWGGMVSRTPIGNRRKRRVSNPPQVPNLPHKSELTQCPGVKRPRC